jgi:hypothetical protein
LSSVRDIICLKITYFKQKTKKKYSLFLNTYQSPLGKRNEASDKSKQGLNKAFPNTDNHHRRK